MDKNTRLRNTQRNFKYEIVQRNFDIPELKGIVVKTKVIEYDQINSKHINILVPNKAARMRSKATQNIIVDSPFPVNSRVARKLQALPGVKVKTKGYFSVVHIPKAYLGEYGVDIACGVLSMIAFPHILAVISICMGILYKIKGFIKRTKISDEMAYFLAFLISINVDKFEIRKESDLKNLYNKQYKNLMSQYYPNIQLKNDFGFVFYGLLNRGLIIDFKGYYQVRKRVLIV